MNYGKIGIEFAWRGIVATVMVLLSATAFAALSAFRWDDVDGKGTSYTTPVKRQTGATDRSYAYAPIDYIETVGLITAKKSYNELTDSEKVAFSFSQEEINTYVSSAQNAHDYGAYTFYQPEGCKYPFLSKSFDWILRSKLNGQRIKHIGVDEGLKDLGVTAPAWNTYIHSLKETLRVLPLLSGYQHVDQYFKNGKYYFFPELPDSSPYHRSSYYRTALIVGYDDSIPASFFEAQGVKPSGDGAWIVKGSYGTSFGDNGYFYISYYDDKIFRSYTHLDNDQLLDNNEYALIPDMERKYGDIYCHSLEPLSHCVLDMLDSCAVVFTAENDAIINAIGIMSLDLTDYEIYAFVGCDMHSPATGVCVIDGGHVDVPAGSEVGYVTCDLPKSFAVKKGQRFSIIIDCAGPRFGVGGVCGTTNPNPVKGRCFKSRWNINGISAMQWTDMSSSKVDNEWFITAYTTVTDDKIVLEASKGTVEEGIAVSWVSSKNGSYDLYRGDKGGALSCIAHGLTARTYLDKINKDIEPDKWYDYRVVDTVNDIESNIDSGIVATKPVLEEVRVAKLWLEQDPPYNVQLKWNRYNAEIFHVDEGDFNLYGITIPGIRYDSRVKGIGKSGDEEVVDLATGGLDIDYGCHGDYNMSVDWKYTNTASGETKSGNSVDDVVAKVYFHKYRRPVGNISNWYIFWPKDKALDANAARLMKPEVWVENSLSQFDGSFYFNPNHIDIDQDSGRRTLTPLGRATNRLKPIRLVDPRHIDCLEKDESEWGFYLSRIKAKLGIYDGDNKFYVWEVAPQHKYFLSDIAAAYGAKIEPSQGGYAGETVGSGEKGLKQVADTMVHELMHGWLFDNLYSETICVGRLGKDGWLQRLSREIIWSDWVLRNAPNGPDSFLLDIKGNWAQDSDGDGISDIYEMNFPELDIGRRDTLNVESFLLDYARYGDNEYLARREETRHEWNKVNVDVENDWAFPGSKVAKDYEDYRPWSWERVEVSIKKPLQNDFSSDASTRAYARLANAIAPNEDEDLHASGSINAFYRPTIGEFIFDVLEIVSVGEGVAQKAKDGGTYASLSFPVTITNMTASAESCILRGYLLDGQSNAVAWASSVLDVPAGSVAIDSLVFDAEHLYSSENKDISLAWVAVEPLGDEFGVMFDITNAMMGTEVAYKLDEFTPPPAKIDTRHIGEEMCEKELAIIVPIENFTADDLKVAATLSGTNGEYVAAASTNVANGTSLARLEFAKAQLAYSGVLGPYVVSSVQVLRGSESICGELNVYMTKEYDESEILLETRVLNIDKDSYSRVRPKRSGEIAFEFSVENRMSNPIEYDVKAFVFGSNDAFVGVWRTGLELVPGKNTVRLSLEIGEGWFKELEPYLVREVVFEPMGDIGERARLTPRRIEFDRKDAEPSAFFDNDTLSVPEGEHIQISILGGSLELPASVDVHLIHNTSSAADLDLSKGRVDRVTPKGGLKFPLTLSWAKGEIGEKVITIPIKTDTSVEGVEMLTLQLSNPKGLVIGENRVCTINIRDMNSNITLAQGLGNESLKPTMSGTGKWMAYEAAHFDPTNGYSVFVQSPDMKSGQVTKLDLGKFNGSGRLQFKLQYVGNDYGETVSTFGLYDNSKRYGPITQSENGDEWHGWQVKLSDSGSHHIVLEFTQGTVPDVHVRVTSVKWVPDNEATCTISIMDMSDDMESFLTDAGCSNGAGTYAPGTKITLKANPRPGYEFDSWLNLTSVEEFSNPKLTVTVTNSTQWLAFYKKIPYIRALADPADGGKVSGSGLCARGKKVTLKATANKNFTFLGWTTNSIAIDSIRQTPTAIDNLITTPSLVIDRSAKPAKDSKTSTTLTNVAEDVTYFAVFKSDPEIFVTVDATDGTGAEPTGKGAGKYVAGTITGMGKYAPGKKVTLKATANKGYVFAGWYETGNREEGIGNREEGIGNREEGIGNSSADGLLSQAASYMIDKMPSNDVEYVAKFVTTDEDKASITLKVDGEALRRVEDNAPYQITNFCGVAMNWPLAAKALSATSIKVAGLPAGLKFTDKPVTTKVGSGKTAVTVTNVPANTIYGAPTAASKTDKNGNVTPSKVVFTVTTAGKSTQTFALNLYIDPLPAWAVGTFDGTAYVGDSVEASGVVQAFTVAANGKISGKLLRDDGTWTLAASAFDSVRRVEDNAPYQGGATDEAIAFVATVIGKSGKLLETNEVTVSATEVELPGGYGLCGVANGNSLPSSLFPLPTSLSWKAFQNLWKRADTKEEMPVFKTDRKVDHWLGGQDDVSNMVTITFKKEGVVSFAGKVGGASVSGTSQLVLVRRDEGTALCQVTLYAPPKGAFAGFRKTLVVSLTADDANIVTAVTVE